MYYIYVLYIHMYCVHIYKTAKKYIAVLTEIGLFVLSPIPRLAHLFPPIWFRKPSRGEEMYAYMGVSWKGWVRGSVSVSTWKNGQNQETVFILLAYAKAWVTLRRDGLF